MRYYTFHYSNVTFFLTLPCTSDTSIQHTLGSALALSSTNRQKYNSVSLFQVSFLDDFYSYILTTTKAYAKCFSFWQNIIQCLHSSVTLQVTINIQVNQYMHVGNVLSPGAVHNLEFTEHNSLAKLL